MRNKLLTFMLTAILIFSCNKNENENTIEESGTVEAKTVIVSSESYGRIIDLLIDEGSEVKSGDTLLTIDHSNLDIKLQQVLAAQKMAEANYNLVKKGAREEDVNSALQNLKAAEADYNLSKTDFERYKKLLSENVVSKKQFENVETKYLVSESRFKSAQQNYKKVKKIFRPEEVQKAEATFEQAKAKVLEVKKSISDSYVVSPINGTVTKLFIEKGETVNRMSALVKIADLSEVEVKVYVAETKLGKVKLGQNADLISDTYQNKTYPGRVVFISPEAEFTPKNIQTKDERVKLVYAVKIKAMNKERELKSGMPVDARIKLN